MLTADEAILTVFKGLYTCIGWMEKRQRKIAVDTALNTLHTFMFSEVLQLNVK